MTNDSQDPTWETQAPIARAVHQAIAEKDARIAELEAALALIERLGLGATPVESERLATIAREALDG